MYVANGSKYIDQQRYIVFEPIASELKYNSFGMNVTVQNISFSDIENIFSLYKCPQSYLMTSLIYIY